MVKCVFLDRDGVINKVKVINGKPHAPLFFKDFKILPNVKKTIEWFAKKKYLVIVITNQPEINKKNLSKTEFDSMTKKLFLNLKIDDLYFCPHTKDQGCQCRKPKIGLFERAITKYNINLKKSYFIGDRKSDIDVKKFITIKTIYIDNDYGEDKPKNFDYTCGSLQETKKFII